MEQIIKKLKTFKNIVPDANYAARSRFLILSAKKIETPQELFYGYLRFIFTESRLAVASLAVVAVIAIFVVYGYFSGTKIQQANNNNEEEGLQIAQTQYYQPTAQNPSFFGRLEQKVGDFFSNIF